MLLGYFGYAYYTENADKMKLVAVDNGDGCVTPTPDTILSGEYNPLTRPLFIYVNKKSLERPEVRAFVEFYMEHGEELDPRGRLRACRGRKPTWTTWTMLQERQLTRPRQVRHALTVIERVRPTDY